jgi:myo-inositol-1(or 4)-monophosphatase
MNTPNNALPSASDAELLSEVTAAVQKAGHAVLNRFRTDARPGNLLEIGAMIAANDEISLAILHAALSDARPTAQWTDDEGGSGHLPDGEWWIVDPVEGAINHLHGLPEWGVTATLVRDNVPVLTAVHLPLAAQTYTALRGGGARLNGKRLYASQKTELNAARVGTGQAVPNEGSLVHNCIGKSVSAMLEAALVVQVSVPATLQLVRVAAGNQDVFWQYSQVRSGLVAGALLVAEAGGSVTDLHGASWHLGSSDFLASAPALVKSAVSVLGPIAQQLAAVQEQA